MKKMFFVLFVVLCFAPGTWAQGVKINPTTVCFIPSADHSAIGLDGQPIVTRYEVRVFVSTDLTKVLYTLDLAKPAPGTDGQICVANAVWFAGLTPKTKYVGKVAAIGPSGEGVSDPSNPFGNQGPAAPPTAVVVK